MSYTKQIHDNLIAETRQRLMNESVPRITQCLVMLTNDEIWQKPNSNSNSIGNLILHLCGNVRQYILSGIDGQEDFRARQNEFDEKGPLEKEFLIEKMNVLMIEVNQALERIHKNDWVTIKKVQCYEMSVLSILIHVIEHFSYHTGQIVYYTKLLKNEDLKFYEGLDLEAKAITTK